MLLYVSERTPAEPGPGPRFECAEACRGPGLWGNRKKWLQGQALQLQCDLGTLRSAVLALL